MKWVDLVKHRICRAIMIRKQQYSLQFSPNIYDRLSDILFTSMTYFSYWARCWDNFLSYLRILTLEGSPSAKRPDQLRSFSRLSELDPLSPSNAPASTKKPLRWKYQYGWRVTHIRSILYPPFLWRVFLSVVPGHGSVPGYHLPSCKAVLMVGLSPFSLSVWDMVNVGQL